MIPTYKSLKSEKNKEIMRYRDVNTKKTKGKFPH